MAATANDISNHVNSTINTITTNSSPNKPVRYVSGTPTSNNNVQLNLIENSLFLQKAVEIPLVATVVRTTEDVHEAVLNWSRLYAFFTNLTISIITTLVGIWFLLPFVKRTVKSSDRFASNVLTRIIQKYPLLQIDNIDVQQTIQAVQKQGFISQVFSLCTLPARIGIQIATFWACTFFAFVEQIFASAMETIDEVICWITGKEPSVSSVPTANGPKKTGDEPTGIIATFFNLIGSIADTIQSIHDQVLGLVSYILHRIVCFGKSEGNEDEFNTYSDYLRIEDWINTLLSINPVTISLNIYSRIDPRDDSRKSQISGARSLQDKAIKAK